ncbi:hypothetical protein [Phaeobacter inhibens]|uniref:hypothetical protein n=1 Tax=Phaeobacter inhibens TaxID=221822 RepID=UPI000CA2A9E0|nr:hypothetical protein [Phaeobacter inhibens]AUQ70801.1 hypothetical protein PhaeoP54_01916 [Phaeobacter inhibens]
MKICIVIPTYRRNVQLVRLLSQLAELRETYMGQAEYSVFVTDSDLNNPASDIIQQLCDRYILNKGTGFDDNLFYFYKDYAGAFDFVFSCSDDDLFNCGPVNALDLLEVAVRQDKAAVHFNHFEYKTDCPDSMDMSYTLSPAAYHLPALSDDPEKFRARFLWGPPRHVGLLYKSSHIAGLLDTMTTFRGTLHLYAVPFMCALESEDASFFDYPLNYFSAAVAKDGAWENTANVFHGLLQYLIASKQLLNPESFEIAQRGFMRTYFGKSAWLRKMISAPLPTETEVLASIEQA